MRLWDAGSGEALRELSGHEGMVWVCAWSPDGRWLASAGWDGTMRLWDASNGEILRIHALCSSRTGGPDGHAVWQPSNNRIVEVGGDAWRYLAWQGQAKDGWPTRLPLEIFGPVPAPARLAGL